MSYLKEQMTGIKLSQFLNPKPKKESKVIKKQTNKRTNKKNNNISLI